MLYIIILKVRKFHQSTGNRFDTAGKKPVGGGGTMYPPPARLIFKIDFSQPVKAKCNFNMHLSYVIQQWPKFILTKKSYSLPIHKLLSPGQWIFDDSNASRTKIPAQETTNIM